MRIPSDIFVQVFAYFPAFQDKRKLESVSRAFKDIVQKTSSLHRHLRLAGSVTDILPFLISASSAGFGSPESKYLEILEIDQIRGTPDEYHRFFSLLKLFLVSADRLHTLVLNDSSDSFLFREPSMTFELLKSTLAHVTIGGQLDSLYCGDDLIQTLIKKSPNLQSVTDSQFYGVSIKSIRALGMGVPNLQSLTLETSFLNLLPFCRIIPLFKNLKHLGFSNFRQSLKIANNLEELRLALLKLQHLQFLYIDLVSTPHKDFLDANDWNKLISGMDGIQELEYQVDFQSFHGEDYDPKSASYIWKNHISHTLPLQSEREQLFITALEAIGNIFTSKEKKWTIRISF